MAIGRMTKPATVLHMQDENEAESSEEEVADGDDADK